MSEYLVHFVHFLRYLNFKCAMHYILNMHRLILIIANIFLFQIAMLEVECSQTHVFQISTTKTKIGEYLYNLYVFYTIVYKGGTDRLSPIAFFKYLY